MSERFDLRTAEEKENTIGFVVATEQFPYHPRRIVAASFAREAEFEAVWETFNNWTGYKRVRRAGANYRPKLKADESLSIYRGRQYWPDWYVDKVEGGDVE